MSVVVDSNLLVALVSGDPRGDRVLHTFLNWIDHEVELHAPVLVHYEVANALTLITSSSKKSERYSQTALASVLLKRVIDREIVSTQLCDKQMRVAI